MNDYKDYISQAREYGALHISNEVLSTIAAGAIMEVDGVCGLAANVGTEFAELLGKKSQSKGVKIFPASDSIRIECDVVLYYGYPIPDTCLKIQTEAAEAVESTTGICVSGVDVTVCGISLEKPS